MSASNSFYPPKSTPSQDKSILSEFTTILRMASGQETEPEFILIEHSYARPWNWQSESSHSHPRKTLFLSKIPKSENDDFIDVEKECANNAAIPYDLVKGKHLMRECERHVVFAKLRRVGSGGDAEGEKEEKQDDDDDDDWEASINKASWSDAQLNLFNRISKILDSDRLAKLTLKDTPNEPLKRRAQIDRTAAKFRQTLGRINWDLKLTQWLHNTFLQNLSTPYLAAYLDVLQTMKSKIPNLVDKMIALSSTHKGPNIEALNLLLKRPWDPVIPILNHLKPCKLENFPVLIQVPSGATSPNVPHASRRIRFFNSQLQHLVKCIPISVTTEMKDAGSILEHLINEVQLRIAECKSQYPSHPIVLLGWGAGAVLACFVSLIEKVAANICLGFPILDHQGKRGDADDPLLDMKTPTLFVMGERATNATVDDMEDFRYHMQAETSLVVISGADLLLRMSLEKRYWDGLTQSMVDRCIVDEIGDFLTKMLNEDNKPTTISLPPSVPSSATTHSSIFSNPTPSHKVIRKDFGVSRKRKLSPLSIVDSTSQDSSKKIRTSTGTAISQTLGLKIPVGSLMKQEGKHTTFSHFNSSMEKQGLMETELNSRQTFKGDDAKTSSSTWSSSIWSGGESAANAKPHQFTTSSIPSDTNNLSIKTTTGSPLSMATISLGGLASLTRQKYQQMIQISENSEPPALSFSKTNTVDRIVNSTKSREKDSTNVFDVNSFGINPVSCTPSGVSGTTSLRNLEQGSGLPMDDASYLQGNQSTQSVHPHSWTEAASAQTMVTSSIINSASTSSTKQPTGARRGRPPGRPKSSVNSFTKGRGKDLNSSSTSMAPLSLAGAAGDGTGGEVVRKAVSTLGRGVLTLAKSGTSTVRVYSASGQKLSSSSTTSPSVSMSSIPKSKGFVLSNISSTSAGIKNAREKSFSSSASISVPGKSNNEPTRRLTTSCTGTITSPSGQVSLNLQGISASRAVSFGNTRSTAVMLLSATNPSSISTVSPNTPTTSVACGGVKATKAIIGTKTCIDEVNPNPKDESQVNLAQKEFAEEQIDVESDVHSEAPLEKKPEEIEEEKIIIMGSNSQSSSDEKKADAEISSESLIAGTESSSSSIGPVDSTKTTDPPKSSLIKNTPKTLVLGTKVVSAPKNSSIKSNITFISSKSLNKAFPSSDELPKQSIPNKPILKNPSGCTFLKMPPQTSSIRLVRSVGVSTLSKGTQNGSNSNSSLSNIIMKTFTVGTNPVRSSTGKRRLSLDSNIKTVTKKSKGTSTDQIPEKHLKDNDSASNAFSSTCGEKSNLSCSQTNLSTSQYVEEKKSAEEQCLKLGETVQTKSIDSKSDDQKTSETLEDVLVTKSTTVECVNKTNLSEASKEHLEIISSPEEKIVHPPKELRSFVENSSASTVPVDKELSSTSTTTDSVDSKDISENNSSKVVDAIPNSKCGEEEVPKSETAKFKESCDSPQVSSSQPTKFESEPLTQTPISKKENTSPCRTLESDEPVLENNDGKSSSTLIKENEITVEDSKQVIRPENEANNDAATKHSTQSGASEIISMSPSTFKTPEKESSPSPNLEESITPKDKSSEQKVSGSGVQRVRRNSLTLLKTSLPELASKKDSPSAVSHKSSSKDRTDPSRKNRVTRSSAKIDSENKRRRLRSSI